MTPTIPPPPIPSRDDTGTAGGPRNTTNHTGPVVVLGPDQVEELHYLIGIVEDWLLHCGEEALEDLGGFLTSAGLGQTPPAVPERLVAELVNDLGEHTVALRAALRRSTPDRAAILGGGLHEGTEVRS